MVVQNSSGDTNGFMSCWDGAGINDSIGLTQRFAASRSGGLRSQKSTFDPLVSSFSPPSSIKDFMVDLGRLDGDLGRPPGDLGCLPKKV